MARENAEFHEQFLRLFTANEAAIRSYVRRLVPARPDASDVMQGIALVLWRKFETLDDSRNFRQWAFGIAKYETLAWRRNKARDRHVLSEEVLELVADETLLDDDRLNSQRDALETCLEKLPGKHRDLVLAAYAPDTEIQQVAESSGRTVGAFYQWLHRTRLKLLDCTRRTLEVKEIS